MVPSEIDSVILENDTSEDCAAGYTPAPIPENEAERLKVLYGCHILETPDEPFFEDVTFLAKTICKTPIALVSLVDKDRQWFKSRKGVDVREMTRDISFCAHGLLQFDTIFEVQDAQADKRFAGNPLVLGDPNIRFYAGAPIVVHGGVPLGMVCVIDRKPRKLTPEQSAGLTSLARRVAAELESRSAAGAGADGDAK